MKFFILLFCLLLTGCAAKEEPDHTAATTAETIQVTEATLPTETVPPDPIRLMLNDMSLEQRVGQLFLARCDDTYALEHIGTYHLGGFVLFGQDFQGQTPDSLRQKLAAYYYEHINNPLITLPDLLPDEQNAYHLFPIIVKGKENRDRLHDYLEQNGVGTVCHYPIAPHKQECYSDWNDLSLPITEQLHSQELSLPISQVMTFDEADEVVELVNRFK